MTGDATGVAFTGVTKIDLRPIDKDLIHLTAIRAGDALEGPYRLIATSVETSEGGFGRWVAAHEQRLVGKLASERYPDQWDEQAKLIKPAPEAPDDAPDEASEGAAENAADSGSEESNRELS